MEASIDDGDARAASDRPEDGLPNSDAERSGANRLAFDLDAGRFLQCFEPTIALVGALATESLNVNRAADPASIGIQPFVTARHAECMREDRVVLNMRTIELEICSAARDMKSRDFAVRCVPQHTIACMDLKLRRIYGKGAAIEADHDIMLLRNGSLGCRLNLDQEAAFGARRRAREQLP